MRRLSRILLWTAGAVLTLVLLAGLVVETSFFKSWLRGFIVRQANERLAGTLAIGRLRGSLFSGIELDDVRVMLDNQPVISIDTITSRYSIRELVSGGVTIDNVTLVHPVVAAHRDGDGWQLSRLVKKDANEADRRGPSKPINIRHINITKGHFTVDKQARKAGHAEPAVNIPDTYDAFEAALSFAYAPVHFTIGIDRMTFVARNPTLELRQVQGAIAVESDKVNFKALTVRTAETGIWTDGAIENYLTKPTFKLAVSMTPLSLPEVHRLVPAVKEMNVTPTVNVRLSGTLEGLSTEFSAKSSAGNFSGKGKVAVAGPDRVFQGELAVHHLDLAPFLNNAGQKSDITVYAKVDVRGPAGFDTLRGTVAADAPRVATHGYVIEGIRANAKIDGRKINFDTSERAYRSNTTAAGSVEFASDTRPETRFDLRGVVKDVGLTYLPKQTRVPPVETKLTANYHVRIVIPRKPGWHVDGDVTLGTSTVAGVTVANGSKASFFVEPNVVRYEADATVADVDLKRIGDSFNITALQQPRYQTNLNGHVVAKVDGTAVETMTLTASGELHDSSLFGGTIPHLTFESSIADNDLHVKASGQLEKINPAIVTGTPSVDGSITGSIDTVELTMKHLSQGTDLNSVGAYVLADFGPSTVGRYSIDKAYVQADYHDAVADVQYIQAYGHDVVAQGNGTIALNDTDQSGFWFHAEASHLGQVGTMMAAGKELTGIGTIDAVLSGNKKEFVANGTATGNGLRYGDYGALAASTTFTAKIPDLDAQRTSVTADTNATFVDIPGFQVNELTAKTEYADKNVKYDLTAKQPMRQLETQGEVVLHPDHNEAHLAQFKLTSQGMAWQNVEGHVPAIQWGNGVVIVKDLALTDAAMRQQQLLANGTFGKPGETLTVELKDINLGIVDAFLLRPQQLAGSVNGKAVISGTTDAPAVAADVAIRNGKFRDIPWQSFTGTVNYSPTSIVLDTKLQQTDAQWLTAKGELPMTFVRGKKTADKLDLHVDSSAIDLGILQGFTSAVTGVRGTLQAKLDLTGTAEDPRVQGGVSIKDGAFKLEDNGVTYKKLNGQIDFLPDRVHITDLHVLDADNDSLSLTGDLGIAGFSVSNVNLGFYADNFKVLGNDVGNLHVSSNLELTGTLAKPKLQGDLGVSTGNIKLDAILAKFNNAYSTTTIDTTKSASVQDDTRPGILGQLELGVHLTIPDDLVVKADDLQVGDAPVGLGRVNITLGGDVNVSAAPGKPITLVGEVNTIRGFYDYQGRRFNILRDGKVQFQGDPLNQLDPALDIAGERTIQAVTVHVNVRGRLRRPEIELTSTPPQEQADILALIIFNQPMNQLGEGQQLSLAQRAGTMAAGAVTSQLTGSIANSLNLDQFEINLSPESGSTAELTIGQQLGQNLYVKVQQGIGDNSQTNFVLEYEFKKWLRLQTNVLEGSGTQQQLFQRVKSTGADLVISFAFK